MGKMTKEQLIAFSRELAWKIYQVDEDVLDEVVVQVSHTIMSLDMLARIEEGKIMFKDYVAPPDTCTNPYLLGYWETEESLEESIPRVAEDEEIEAVLFCEGELWEKLYYAEGYGTTDKKTKEIYEAFVQTVDKHGLWYEWGSGIVFLYRIS